LDSDGLTNFDEATIHQSALEAPDSDDDGMLDGAEIIAGTDPLFNRSN